MTPLRICLNGSENYSVQKYDLGGELTRQGSNLQNTSKTAKIGAIDYFAHPFLGHRLSNETRRNTEPGTARVVEWN